MGYYMKEKIVLVLRFLSKYKQLLGRAFSTACLDASIYWIHIEHKKKAVLIEPFPELTAEERIVYVSEKIKEYNIKCLIICVLIIIIMCFLNFLWFFKDRENCSPFYYWKHYFKITQKKES